MKFHPDSELLLRYASGQLEPSLSLAIALHQQECRECQQKITELESIGGQALGCISESTLSNQVINLSFENLMQSIDLLPEKNTQINK